MIVVVDEGRVVESGSHTELMAKEANKPNEDSEASPTLPLPTRAKSGGSPLTKSLTAKDLWKVPGSLAAPARAPPLVTNRSTSEKNLILGSADKKKQAASYKRLWEAAIGGGEEKLSMSALSKKVEGMEEELTRMKAKIGRMQAAKSALLGETAGEVETGLTAVTPLTINIGGDAVAASGLTLTPTRRVQRQGTASRF